MAIVATRRATVPWLRAIVLLGLASANLDARQDRELTDGAALLTGVVLTDSRPVSNVLVSVHGDRLPAPRAVTTDDQGRFSLRDLPAGQYRLSATRVPYVIVAVDGVRWPSTQVSVMLERSVRTHVAIDMAIGGSLEGRVTDPFGQPLSGVPVAVLRRRNGPAQPAVAATTTDYDGRYRLDGLPSGDYVVRAAARSGNGSPGLGIVDDAAFREAEQAARDRRPVRMMSGGASTGGVGDAADYGVTFYGATLSLAEALPVALAGGQHQSGIDIRILLSRTVTVRGRVVRGDGSPAPAARVQLLPDEPGAVSSGPTTVALDREGSFVSPGLRPGRYRLVARDISPGSDLGEVTVQVPGDEVSPIVVTLTPGATVSGRLLHSNEGDVPFAPERARELRVVLRRTETAITLSSSDALSSAVDEHGRFSIRDVAPGPWELSVTAGAAQARPGSGEPPDGLVLESVRLGPATLNDRLVRVAASTNMDVDVRLSSQASALSGRILGLSPALARAVSVVVMPADPEARRSSGRVRVTPVIDGARFAVAGLAAGSYLVAVVAAIDLADLLDRATLEDVAAHALPVDVGPGDRRVFDVQVAQ